MLLKKYHGLGNDYFVMRPLDGELSEAFIQKVCNRNFGAGSDGILAGPYPPGSEWYEKIAKACGGAFDAAFALRILNPDGSEAEKSGNGLRIFAQYLFDEGIIGRKPVRLLTLGGVVTATVHEPMERIEIEMGAVVFRESDIPVRGFGDGSADAVNLPMTVLDREFMVSAASVGNPHCVIPLPEVSKDIAMTYGPVIENDAHFPNRTNVQFLQKLDEHAIRIEIWERGAGYTLASGSSSSAAAAVAVRLGLCSSPVTVKMPGGILDISIDKDWQVTLVGPACQICDVIWPD
ncbi:MAG: diaminopimelate epimerase [Victivallales bacterium]|nr:diaminopimelate epimerase [Victivallales bacterium]